ncbi:hypothetical protein CDIK_3514 [Cucumispora dikerogammari]|nr:hypothetical protein CDIK_3514 [Cucumispora dikerogammari]
MSVNNTKDTTSQIETQDTPTIEIKTIISTGNKKLTVITISNNNISSNNVSNNNISNNNNKLTLLLKDLKKTFATGGSLKSNNILNISGDHSLNVGKYFKNKSEFSGWKIIIK